MPSLEERDVMSTYISSAEVSRMAEPSPVRLGGDGKCFGGQN